MSSGHGVKRELRPMLVHKGGPIPARPSSSPPVPPGTGSRVAVIVLALVILAQLGAIAIYLIAHHRPPPPAPLPICDQPPHGLPSQTLSLISTASRQKTPTETLPDAQHALNAIHFLKKFLRQRQARVEYWESDGEWDHAHAASAHGGGDVHDESYLQAHDDLYHAMWLNISQVWAEDQLNPERIRRLSDTEQARVNQCTLWGEKYAVLVDVSWGELPAKFHLQFDQLGCPDTISMTQVAKYITANPTLYSQVWPVPAGRTIPRPESGMEEKVIAIVTCVTTRSIPVGSLDDLALFSALLPSFIRTAEEGFEYWFYLGFDNGDPWLDNAANLNRVREWWRQHVEATLKQRGVVAKLVLAQLENTSQLPGPAFNHVTGVAYADGATWIYRVNDDQSFDTPWASAFVQELTAMGPPYGVVGPVCQQGATHILVVDFVHRTHHEIFPTHYPPSLQAHWMDNWISQVYGRKRTKRVSSAKISHLTGTHGTRYTSPRESGQYMRGEITRGRVMLEEYLSHTPSRSKVLAEYRADEFAYAI